MGNPADGGPVSLVIEAVVAVEPNPEPPGYDGLTGPAANRS